MSGWYRLHGLLFGVGLALLSLTAVAAPPPSGHAADVQQFDAQFRPLLAQYCVTCHSGDRPKGNLQLDGIGVDFSDSAIRQRWALVVKRLQAGEMPPKQKPRPPANEIQALTDWLNHRLTSADAAANAVQGRVVL